MTGSLSRGLFITLEGGEGSGKSTQAARLAAYLSESGHEVVLTREPGGTETAEAIRRVLLDPAYDIDPMEQVLLLLAARANHIRTLIAPALARRAIVVCDRFSDSTMAYQGIAGDMGRETVTVLQQNALGDFAPHLTMLFDIPVLEAARRRAERGGGEDRFEAMNSQFHERLRRAFLEIAEADPSRVVVIDAAPDPEAVWQAVRAVVDARIAELKP